MIVPGVIGVGDGDVPAAADQAGIVVNPDKAVDRAPDRQVGAGGVERHAVDGDLARADDPDLAVRRGREGRAIDNVAGGPARAIGADGDARKDRGVDVRRRIDGDAGQRLADDIADDEIARPSDLRVAEIDPEQPCGRVEGRRPADLDVARRPGRRAVPADETRRVGVEEDRGGGAAERLADDRRRPRPRVNDVGRRAVHRNPDDAGRAVAADQDVAGGGLHPVLHAAQKNAADIAPERADGDVPARRDPGAVGPDQGDIRGLDRLLRGQRRPGHGDVAGRGVNQVDPRIEIDPLAARGVGLPAQDDVAVFRDDLDGPIVIRMQTDGVADERAPGDRDRPGVVRCNPDRCAVLRTEQNGLEARFVGIAGDRNVAAIGRFHDR